MFSKLSSKKIEDQFVGLKEIITPSIIRMGFNSTGRWVKKIVYYLFNKVKSQWFLVSLIGSLNDDNAWIIDSGASRHMTRERKQLQTISKEPYSHVVELGDNKSYVFRGLRSTSSKLENGAKLHLNNTLYIPGLKKKNSFNFFLRG